MNYVKYFERVERPFDPMMGFYAMVPLLYINTYYSINPSMIDLKNWVFIPNQGVIFLIVLVVCLVWLPYLGRALTGLIWEGLVALINMVFGKEGYTSKREKKEGYSVYSVKHLYYYTGDTLLGKLVKEGELKEKKFKYSQNAAFSLAVLIPVNIMCGGYLARLTEYVSNDLSNGLYVIFVIIILLLLRHALLISDVRVPLAKSLYEKIQDESGYEPFGGNIRKSV